MTAVLEYSFNKDTLQLRIQVVPRASRSEVMGEHNGALRVRVAAAPVDGAANVELIRVLARKFGVPRSSVQIVSGQSARIKQVRIDHASKALVQAITGQETSTGTT